jgi:hypothetical protein
MIKSLTISGVSFQTEGSVFGQGQAERQIKFRDHYVCSSASSSKKTDVSRPILKKEVSSTDVEKFEKIFLTCSIRNLLKYKTNAMRMRLS